MARISLFSLNREAGFAERDNSGDSGHRGKGRRAIARVVALSCILTFTGFAVSANTQQAAAVPPPFPILDPTDGPPDTFDSYWDNRRTGFGNPGGYYTKDGWLRLTSNGEGQATNLLNKTAFPSSEGFEVSFDYRQAGGAYYDGSSGPSGTGDGIAMYLVDGSADVSVGAPGAGLGYAAGGSGIAATGQNCTVPGVIGGYLGLGIDVFGNYASPNFGNGGGDTSLAGGEIALRGSGSGCTGTYAQRYPWVKGVREPNLWTGPYMNSDPAGPSDTKYRRVSITVVPAGATLQVTVAMSNLAVKTAAPGPLIEKFSYNLNGVTGQVALPPTLKLGFSASTGAATDYHDIRNVRVSALTDTAITKTLATTTPGHAGYPAGTFLPGDPISFTLTATNNGPSSIGDAPNGVSRVFDDLSGLPIKDVSWTCSASSDAACENGDSGTGSVVAQDWTGKKGSSVTVTVSGTVTATPGEFTNTAILPTDFTKNVLNPDVNFAQADGGAIDTDLKNNTSSADFTVVTPAIGLVKTAKVGGVATTDMVAGQTITYEFQVTNTATTPLNNIAINETGFSGTGTLPTPVCLATSLNPGESTTCTADYKVTQADFNSGKLTNSATAQGTAPGETTPTVSDPASAELTSYGMNPVLDLEKTGALASGATGKAGDTINYTFKATNNGNVTLTNVTITDPLVGLSSVTYTWPAGGTPGTLEPGESVTGTASYVVKQADVDAGKVHNEAEAKGTPPSGSDVTGTDETDVPLVASPGLKVTKKDDISGFSSPVFAGDSIGYTVDVENNGNVKLTGVTVDDPLVGGDITADCVWPGAAGELVPGQTVSCTASYKLSQDDLDAGTVLNEATATGYDHAGTKVSDTGDVTTDLTKTPGYGPKLETKKTADDSGLSSPTKVDDPIVYTITATNTGDVTLKNVTVDDPLLGGNITSSCTWPNPSKPGVLSPKQKVTCEVTYLVTQDDIDAGGVTNVATVTGEGPDGSDGTDGDEVTTDIPSGPSISLLKTGALAKNPAYEGDTVTFGFEATNDGDITLNGVSISDPLLGSATITYTWPGAVGVLAPGQSVTGTATYTLTQTDIDAGHVYNKATAKGTPPATPLDPHPVPVTDDGDVTVDISSAGALIMHKSAGDAAGDPITELVAGETVYYSFVVENTGNVTVSGIDISETNFTGTGTMSAVNCPSDTLAPGDSVTCTATYVITQDDVDAGSLSNTAVGHGNPPDDTDPPVDSPPDTVVVPADVNPALTVTKTDDLSGFSSPVFAGDKIGYTVDVKNSGNVTLTGVTVKDPLVGGDITADCAWPGVSGKLIPGQTVSCTTSYKLLQKDLDAGKVTNKATATGYDPDGTEVFDTGEVTTDLTKTPGYGPKLTVNKTDDDSGLSDPPQVNDPIVYTITATNDGDVTLTGVTVDDALLGGHITSRCTWDGTPGTLLPGEAATCVATYYITQDDIDAGEVVNTAIAHGTPPSTPENPDPNPEPGDDTVTTDLPSEPGLSIHKSAADAAGDLITELVAGETVYYSFVVENTGNLTMSDITVEETKFTGTGVMSPVVCPSGALEPGESVTCTATYVITQDDVDAGTLTNTAVGHGNPPDDTDPPVDSPPDTITVPADVNPALTVTKTDDLSGFSSPVFAGDKIGYKVNVKNSGNVTLKNVTVNDPLVGGDITADCAWPGTTGKLIPGQTVVCTASYTLSQDDLDAGKVLNKATATGYDPDGTKVSDTGEVTTDLTKTPGYGPKMKTKKTADKSGLSDPPQVLDPIVYTITATNLGNVTLTGVTVEDALLGGDITSSCTWPTPSKPGVLLPKQTATCTATYLLTQDDLDNGQVTNTAIGKGTPPSTPDNPDPDPEPDEDTITTDVPSAPGLTMHKSAADAAGDPITELVAGEKVYYSFVVTNTGDVRVSAIGIHETDFTGTGTMHIGCPTNTLEPGDSVTCTATYVITQDDVDAGTLKNTAVGYGNPPDDTDPPVESPPDTVVVPADVQPALTVTKTADLSWFSTPVFADDPIGYTVEVKNSGNVTLKNVTVDDPLLGGDVTADCVWPGVSGKLIPGQTASCMKAYSLTQEDLDAGKVTNKATATGYDPDGTKVSDTGEVTTDLTKTPGYGPKMKTEKTADKSGLSDPPQVDDPIVYTITAANIGDVTLTGVTVEDQLLGGDITSSCTWPNPAKPGVLLPKQKATCGGTYRLTQDDLDNAEVANTAIGTGTPPSTPDDPDPEPEPDEVTIVTPIPSAPAISLTKTGALSTTPAHAGDTVRWGFEAKNTGDVNLTNVSITDSLTGLSSITYHWPGPVGVLKPGQVVTGEATYLLTQPDMNAGHVLNQAKVTGTPRKGPAVTANGEKDVTIPQAGTLTMKKIASEADGSPVTVLVVGDTIHYSFVVTNDSNVTVTGISINETSFTGTGTMSAVDCPSTTLTPGASTTCTATYVVTQDDVYAGTLTNTAVGHGNPPDVDSPPDTVTVPEDQKPSLALHKTGALAAGATGVAGDIVEYTFTVTNTGNITVKNISIDDKMIGLSNVTYHWPGPNGMLTPGQQMTATATYTLTQKDVDAGGVHNAATVCDNQAVCDDDSTDVPVTARPELELIKTASINGGPADNALIGQVIEYKFKVTNTGNVTMSSLSIIEQQFTGAGQMSGIDCSATTLAPGEVMYCTASYTVTQGDVDAVQVKNTAVAQGTPPAVQTDPSTGKPVLGNCPTCTLTTPSPITSNTGTALVTMDPDPTLSMVKTANVATFTAGTVITYTFKITNTGNLTISNVNVAEGVFTGSGRMSSIKCPATPSLAPGQAVVCTATYTATSADVAAGVLGNTATAIGDPPNNGITPQNKVQSPPSAVTIRAATVVVQTGGIPAASAGAALPIGLAVFGLLVLGASLLLAPKTRQRRYMPHR